MKKNICFACVAILVWIGTNAVAQRVPQLVSYQGVLSDGEGTRLTNNFVRMAVSLYDSGSGGTPVWGPQIFDPVPLQNGRFAVILGLDTNGVSISSAFDAPERYVGVTVCESGEDVNQSPEMAPRQQLLGVPYAFESEKLAGHDWGSILVHGNDPTVSQIAASSLQDNGITSDKIANGTITADKIHPDVVALGVPPGAIIMWSGSLSSIPAGWVLCNGQNGTPDLRNRFIMGAGSAYAPGDAGGVSTINLAHSHTVNSHSHSMQNHTHSIGSHVHSIGSHAHSMSHTHTTRIPLNDWGYKDVVKVKGRLCASGTSNDEDHTIKEARYLESSGPSTSSTGSSSSGSTGVTTIPSAGPSSSSTGTSSVGTNTELLSNQSILNPYYALAFIMKL